MTSLVIQLACMPKAGPKLTVSTFLAWCLNQTKLALNLVITWSICILWDELLNIKWDHRNLVVVDVTNYPKEPALTSAISPFISNSSCFHLQVFSYYCGSCLFRPLSTQNARFWSRLEFEGYAPTKSIGQHYWCTPVLHNLMKVYFNLPQLG